MASRYRGERGPIWNQIGRHARRFHAVPALGFGEHLGGPVGDAADTTLAGWVRSWDTHLFDRPSLVDGGLVNARACERARVALAEIINQAFAAYDKDVIIDMLEETRIACASLNSDEEVSEHEFLQNRTVQMGDKIIDIADLPVRRAKGSVTRAPVLDEDGAKIREEFN